MFRSIALKLTQALFSINILSPPVNAGLILGEYNYTNVLGVEKMGDKQEFGEPPNGLPTAPLHKASSDDGATR